MQKRGKRGLSTVIVTLIIVLVSLVAVGIIWVVVRNIIQTGTEGVGLSQFSLSAKIISVSIDNSSNDVNVTVKRNAGKGDLSGISFIFSSEENTEVITRTVSLNELEQVKFNLHLTNTSVSDLISVSIVPLIKQDEKQIPGIVLDKYNFGKKKNNPPGEICLPSICSDLGYLCGTWNNGTCSGDLNCGTCTGGQSCNASGMCVAGSCTPSTCASSGYECGIGYVNGTCAGDLNCGSCSDEDICNSSGKCVGEVGIQCGVLDSPGTIYNLTTDVNSLGTCFTITAQNITLDCKGHSINFSQGGASMTYGIRTSQTNTTIKNCNIYDGNWTSLNTFRVGIYYVGTSRGTIINNNVSVSNIYGIWLSYSPNNTLINNIGRSNSSWGIYLDASSNNTLINNIGRSNSSWGMFIQTASNNLLINNIGISHSSFAMAFSAFSNNTLINNRGISNLSAGIDIRSFSQNNTLINNTGVSNSGPGITLFSSSNNNILTNCTGKSNSSQGVRLDASSNNRFYGLTATSFTSSNSWGIYISTSSSDLGNNLFQDCINVTGAYGDVYSRGTHPNNTFINCSYRTIGTNETVGIGGEIIRKWYYRAYVQDAGGNPVNNVNVSARNSTGSLIFSELFTNPSGWTNTATIIDYVSNGTRMYYSNYNISARNAVSISSHLYNVTLNQNNFADVFTLS